MGAVAPVVQNVLAFCDRTQAKPGDGKPMRVLVIGGAGYLGSMLVGQLLQRGYRVRILDAFWFGAQSLRNHAQAPRCEIVRGDLRDTNLAERCIAGCDAVIHLGAVVGDSACEEHPSLAMEVNRDATVQLVKIARQCGVSRFLFASSCSVYGASQHCLDEHSPTGPLSLYAKTKLESEGAILDAATLEFCPTVLRLGTLFGASPRMRFDLIVNLFVAQAVSSGRISLWNGEQWRPFLHVQDAGRAFMACLQAPASAISGEVFNVGSDVLNLQMCTLSEEVARLIPNTHVDLIHTEDRRNYRVSFGKFARVLGFACERNLTFGVDEMHAWIAAQPMIFFDSAEFNNQRAMRRLASLLDRRVSPQRSRDAAQRQQMSIQRFCS